MRRVVVCKSADTLSLMGGWCCHDRHCPTTLRHLAGPPPLELMHNHSGQWFVLFTTLCRFCLHVTHDTSTGGSHRWWWKFIYWCNVWHRRRNDCEGCARYIKRRNQNSHDSHINWTCNKKNKEKTQIDWCKRPLRASPPTTTNKFYSFQFLSEGRGTCSETKQTTSWHSLFM